MALAQIDVPTINSWVTLVVAVGSFAVAVGGFIYKIGQLQARLAERALDTDERFKKHGERMGQIEQRCQASTTALEEMRRIDQQHEFKLLDLMRDNGEIHGKLDRVIDNLARANENKSREERDIADRLARIEERLDIFISLKRGNSPGGRNDDR